MTLPYQNGDMPPQACLGIAINWLLMRLRHILKRERRDISSMQEQPVLEKNIIVHRKRGLAISLVVSYAIISLFLTAILVLLVWLTIIDHGDISVDLFVSIIGLLSIFISIRIIWHSITRQIMVHDPVLIINNQGIHVGKLPLVLGEVSILWDEMSAIYSYQVFSRQYLCIRLKDSRQYLSRFSFWKRLLLQSSLKSGAPINVRQDWLAQSVSAILQQIRLLYAQKLHNYDIQLRR